MDATFWFFCIGIGVGVFLGWHLGYGAACKRVAIEMREDRQGPNVAGNRPPQAVRLTGLLGL